MVDTYLNKSKKFNKIIEKTTYLCYNLKSLKERLTLYMGVVADLYKISNENEISWFDFRTNEMVEIIIEPIENKNNKGIFNRIFKREKASK